MSKKAENQFFPKIRFKEFSHHKGWIKKALGEVAKVVASGDLDETSFSPKQSEVYKFPVYSNSIAQEGLYGYASIPKYNSNNVTITARGTLGVAFVRRRDFVGIGRLLVLSEFKDIDANFLKENWNFKAEIPLENGGIPQLTAVKAKLVLLLFPTLEEQQKIAACLSSLDNLIAAESEKLEVLKEYKKGLLQNLFPGEGESVPRVRFREFEKSGDWETKILGEICKMQAGKFISASEISESFFDKSYPCYGGNGLRGYVKSFTNSGLYSLIGRQGALCGNVTLADGDFYATEHAVVVTPEKSIDSLWLYYVLNLLNLNQYATGQAQPGLSVSNLEKVILKVPNKIEEQIEIAKSLFSLDKIISVQEKSIENLKLHKKGLLQGLFPTITEEN